MKRFWQEVREELPAAAATCVVSIPFIGLATVFVYFIILFIRG